MRSAASQTAVLTRWPILHEHRVTANDLDDGGLVTDRAVERWLAAARSAYLDRCPSLRALARETGAEVELEAAAAPRGAMLGHPASVLVATSAPSQPRLIHPRARIRPLGDRGGSAVHARWTVRLKDQATGAALPIDARIRSELIALEQSATDLL